MQALENRGTIRIRDNLLPLAILLGVAQDAGLPQSGCGCANCEAAWLVPSLRRHAASLGLVDTASGDWFMIDATPDFRGQYRMMSLREETRSFAGIVLTHAHTGHYTGLANLGTEAMATDHIPVYATEQLCNFLRHHAPWRGLVEGGNIRLHELLPERPVQLTDTLMITPTLVPHRAEWSDTIACIVQGPERSLLYLPDIDSWEAWERSVRDVVEEVDIALLDGTFFSADELPGRAMSRVPHPLVSDTAERLSGVSTMVRMIHLNHTNPLHHESVEREWLRQRGISVGIEGEEWTL